MAEEIPKRKARHSVALANRPRQFRTSRSPASTLLTKPVQSSSRHITHPTMRHLICFQAKQRILGSKSPLAWKQTAAPLKDGKLGRPSRQCRSTEVPRSVHRKGQGGRVIARRGSAGRGGFQRRNGGIGAASPGDTRRQSVMSLSTHPADCRGREGW